ncbi:class I adenylate-forming enzyme family protein [Nocardioides acrostichi]|uniref:Acyl--CoA ligase n=1 Tax=Nocardioides acrostichi TaxID=2784339 RepID=A0A930UV78_9ACTN|nr:class I adenylate-forming enzyme family protein [Nocardioides acrostichi]MBF4160796.1 acyl--CoA ligase [Nocardioides acrostichi]
MTASVSAPVRPHQNLGWLVERHARGPGGSRVAFEFEGEPRTFAALHDRSLRLAAGLADRGVRRGDRVGVLLGNGHAWVEVLFGLAALGAVTVPVNVLLRSSEVEHIMEDAQVTCLVADASASGCIAKMSGLPPLVVAVGPLEVPAGTRVPLVVAVGPLEVPAGTRVVRYDDLFERRPASGARAFAGTDAGTESDLAMLYYSSGTTGRPKAAAHTHEGVLWNTFGQVAGLDLTPDDVNLIVPSMSWAAGFHTAALALAWLGGRNVVLPTGSNSIGQIASVVERSHVTHTFLAPTLLRRLLASASDIERLRKSSLRWIITGSEPVPLSVVDALATELPGCALIQGYGLSEFPNIATSLRADEARTHAGSAGRVLPHTEMAVRTDSDEIVAAGEGEILLRSPATMRGYFNKPAESEAAFRDGWLNTGDRGSVDDEGYLTLTGRVKDMIISGGLNVYPAEIEETLHLVSRRAGFVLSEVTVVGVADDTWGEIPVAVCGEDLARDKVDALLSGCREHLASYKVPKALLHYEQPLPRTATGKILKRELRPWAQANIRHREDAR